MILERETANNVDVVVVVSEDVMVDVCVDVVFDDVDVDVDDDVDVINML